ncbi:hypothetical protein AAG570_006885 [Ranatra chinensis]|uniref:Vesicle transport v-SNARE N-terminal domain-containing protein n=1 Tax=Ranatra chinensis TaxID=642074 RepID=A0ABD0YVC9_9HEMI
MSSLLDNYEQQYAVLTADFTSKIAKLASLDRAEKRSLSQDLEKHLDELQELLEQMDLEVREIDPSQRPKLRTRVESYRTELNRLEKEFKLRNSINNYFYKGFVDQNDLYGEVNLREEQKQRLLDSSERLERTGNQLNTGYSILLETEDIGSQVLRDLHSQRETIQKSRSRLRETDAELNRGSRLLNSMIAKSFQHRIVLLIVIAFFLTVVGLSLYYAVTRGR